MEYHLRLSNGKTRKISEGHYNKIMCRAWARDSKKMWGNIQEEETQKSN